MEEKIKHLLNVERHLSLNIQKVINRTATPEEMLTEARNWVRDYLRELGYTEPF